ncbi:MAG: L,D-transpeptidase family protein [Ferruginibacter sp.]
MTRINYNGTFPKKINEVALLDSFLSRSGKILQDWEPVNIYYQRLKTALLRYHVIDKAGGWKEIPADKLIKYNPGDSALLIKEIKKRLQISGEYQGTDIGSYYSAELLPAVKSKQRSFGLKEDGVISYALVTALNIPVKERIRQMLINLERMRWAPQEPEPDMILVNIPEFKLHVFQDAKKLFSMGIVVGKSANGTVIFTNQLKYVVFSPYWNIPPSIVRKEILPAIRRNPNYLSKMNMERTGYSGGLPVIRQKPGGNNSLGRVKFIFPNSYNIYFHDTPAKSLFNKEERAFSHGCIRLSEPEKLATYLLRDQPEWTTETIGEAMNASKEKWVPLSKEVQVFISYFTAWVDNDGLLNFRKDIYGHDKKMAMQLFE